MRDRTYKKLEGYARVDLSDETLEQWRTGNSAANPAEAQALTRALDEATTEVDDYESSWLLYSRATQRLSDAYLNAHPDFPPNTLPDTGAVCAWASDRLVALSGAERAFKAEVARQNAIDDATFELMARQRGWLAPTETEDTLRAEVEEQKRSRNRELQALGAVIKERNEAQATLRELMAVHEVVDKQRLLAVKALDASGRWLEEAHEKQAAAEMTAAYHRANSADIAKERDRLTNDLVLARTEAQIKVRDEVDDVLALLWHESQLDRCVIADAGVMQRSADAIVMGLHVGAAKKWPGALAQARAERSSDDEHPLPLSRGRR